MSTPNFRMLQAFQIEHSKTKLIERLYYLPSSYPVPSAYHTFYVDYIISFTEQSRAKYHHIPALDHKLEEQKVVKGME